MLDLHRHDCFSSFDGFGRPADLAKLAAENALDALGISNHGCVNGLVEHYSACKANDIKPILGCEVYFQPKFNEDKPTYHLCLFAKSVKGYENLNKILTEANDKYFYRKARVTLGLLKKYHEGIICTTACVASYFAQKIINNKVDSAKKMLEKFQDIFSDDLYIEIQPYRLSDENLQETVNEELMGLADELDIECILTSDSHYGSENEFDTYTKIHEIGGHGDYAAQYKERYMPKRDDLFERFLDMHHDKKRMKQMKRSMKALIDKVDGDLLDNLPEDSVVFDPDIDADKVCWQHIKNGLKERGKYNKEYLDRCKQEFEVIKLHGFSDYFLIVQDYVKWAKEHDIKVGPGRGSVCNSEVAYALGITDVDSLYFNLDFTRFLRKDKKKMPDVDLDFERDKRQQVIDYLLQRYSGKAAQICSYGLYRVDNTLNDLFKVCEIAKEYQPEIKKFINKYIDKETLQFNFEAASADKNFKHISEDYSDIIVHFARIYKNVRFIGTHAAGVAICGTDLSKFAALEKRGGKLSCVYNMESLDTLHVLKFDMLGLVTMSEINELEQMTGETFDESWLEDKKALRNFKEGNTSGIFQFESKTARSILYEIETNCFEDVIAANAMNRPGPLQLGMPEQYANNKHNLSDVKKSKYYKQTKDTYGTIVYQEQIMAVCRDIGELPPEDVDAVLKFMKGSGLSERALHAKEDAEVRILNEFIEGAKKHGLNENEARDTFDKLIVYSFNKGHATGYAMIASILMHYKMYYPLEFWVTKLKYAPDNKLDEYKVSAVHDGNIILLPHVNGEAEFSLTEYDGDKCFQEGLCNIKNVGGKAAQLIAEEKHKNGKFKNYKDFCDRCERSKIVTIRVINALENAGALEFNKNKFLKRTEQYNMTLFGRG